MKKKINKKKKSEEKKGKKLVVCVLGAALSCAIYDATIENTLFEDNDGANIFCAFNSTQGIFI
jgi:hypothetical protein